MTGGRSWHGDWKGRLYERVRQIGYDSLTAFAEARPAVSTLALAEELGVGDINAVQVNSALLLEAEQNNRVGRFVRDVLARYLSEYLPAGWPAVMDDKARLAVAKALSGWIVDIPEALQERAEEASQALLASPLPPGWRPLGPDDERLQALFPDE